MTWRTGLALGIFVFFALPLLGASVFLSEFRDYCYETYEVPVIVTGDTPADFQFGSPQGVAQFKQVCEKRDLTNPSMLLLTTFSLALIGPMLLRLVPEGFGFTLPGGLGLLRTDPLDKFVEATRRGLENYRHDDSGSD